MALGFHTFIIKNDGTVYSTGRNDDGQLGFGDTTNRKTFTKVDIDNVKSISCGYYYTFILKNDGTLYSTGRNTNGELGFGDTTDRATFTKVDIDDVKAVSCGLNHTFILKNDGTVYSTGRNDNGQLGLGDTAIRKTFTKVDIDDVKSISCGCYYTFIIKNDGTVYSTGDNNSGQLGLGDNNNNNRKLFTKVDIDDVKAVSCGLNHTFILKNYGTVYSTGRNDNGQLGSDTAIRKTFTKVDIDDVKAVSCGYTHTFILKNDGTVYSTGSNVNGQLGLSDTSIRKTFTKVDIDDVKTVSCGYNHTFILKNDGTVYSTGSNKYGQLGLGNNTNNATFTKVDIDDVETVNDVLYYILFLIKSLSKYYTIKDSTLTETTLNNFDIDAVKLDVVNDNISLLPNNFSLVTNEKCELRVWSKTSYMVVPKYALSIDSVVFLNNIGANFTNKKSSLKLVVSVDDGENYYTYNNNSFERVDITIPSVDYNSFTEIDSANWENAKAVIYENGIDMSAIGSIDFKKMGLLYGKDFKMKYALVVTVEGVDSSISVNNIEVTYSSK